MFSSCLKYGIVNKPSPGYPGGGAAVIVILGIHTF
jgi:hypothetical protein